MLDLKTNLLMLLFLDDERSPEQITWPVSQVRHGRVVNGIPEYAQKEVEIVKTVDGFVAWIKTHGVPDAVSFDNNLGTGSPGRDGLKAARWLVRFCEESNTPLPAGVVHSKNPIAAKEIVLSVLDYRRPDSRPSDEG
jgi:hypothetical protein